MTGKNRKIRRIIGTFFVISLILLYKLAEIDSYPLLDSYPALKNIFGIFLITSLGPLMSLIMINHYNWAINSQDILLLAFSWLPAILLFLGFFVIKNKKYIISLILGTLFWPVVGFFWVAMGA